MKFLVIQHYNNVFYALPREKQVEVQMGAVAFANKYMQSGKCKTTWLFSDRKGNASIWEYESEEQLLRLCVEYPLTPYTDMEFIPVVDFEAGVKILQEIAAAAQKTTPQNVR